jgi:hypothetical protein
MVRKYNSEKSSFIKLIFTYFQLTEQSFVPPHLKSVTLLFSSKNISLPSEHNFRITAFQHYLQIHCLNHPCVLPCSTSTKILCAFSTIPYVAPSSSPIFNHCLSKNNKILNSHYIIFYLFSFLLILRRKFAPYDFFLEHH